MKTFTNTPHTQDDTLRLYAIIRSDLDMSPGKMASQAGHAFTNTLLKSYEKDPILVQNYQGPDGIGTKVVLDGHNLGQLLQAFKKATEADIPCALITDTGHSINGTPFNGEPIVTALGIGPACRSEIKHITKHFNCVK